MDVYNLDLLVRRAMRRERVFKDRLNPLDDNEDKLISKYRFGRAGLLHLLQVIDLENKTKRSHALLPIQRLCLALRFYAGGAFLQTCSDTVSVTEPSTSRAVTRVTDALCELVYDHISMPTDPRELLQIKQSMYDVAGMPRVIGLIDGTHIKIQAPSHYEKEYVNRKQVHSINVQIVVDHKQMIRNVVASWPGSTHDSRILRESGVWEEYENSDATSVLLGDSGYPCRPWLLTPVAHPLTEKEENYNRVIVACCVLFNIRKSLGMPDEVDVAAVQPPDNDDAEGNNNAEEMDTGAGVRRHIIATFF